MLLALGLSACGIVVEVYRPNPICQHQSCFYVRCLLFIVMMAGIFEEASLYEREDGRTMFKSFQALSLGWAPTPIQYFALEVSSLTSLNGRCLGFSGCMATGLYVPRTSSGFELRAVLEDN